MTEKRVLAARHARDEKYRAETAAKLHAVAHWVEQLAVALEDDDGILGTLAGSGLADVLPALPANVRETFMENLSDEAASGYRADQAYIASRDETAPMCEHCGEHVANHSLRVPWREPMRLCAQCFWANESTRP